MAAPVPAIATHPDRAQIEIGLANGVSLRGLSKRYGLDPAQLSRYRKSHMSDELILRLRVRGLQSDEELGKIREIESKSLLDHLTYQRSRLYTVADRAASIAHDEAEIRAIEAAGRASERIGRLLGELGATSITNNNVQINLMQSPEWHNVRTQIVQALKPHPAAWQSVIKALERIEQVDHPRLLEGVRVA